MDIDKTQYEILRIDSIQTTDFALFEWGTGGALAEKLPQQMAAKHGKC